MDEERQDNQPEVKESKSPSPLVIVGFLVVVGLVIAGLFLPPISLGQRLGLGGDDADTAVTTDADDDAGDTVAAGAAEIPGEFAINGADTAVSVSSIAADGLASAGISALPQDVNLVGNVYSVAHDGSARSGQAVVNYPASADANLLDLYGWNGSAWQFVPSTVTDNQQIVSNEHNLYQAFALAQPAAPQAPVLAAGVQAGAALADELATAVNEVSTGYLTLVGNGDLQGDLNSAVTGDFDRYLVASNVGAIVDQASLSSFLNDATAQADQIDVLVNTAVSGNYAGVKLDYQGVSTSQKEAFTSFVAQLSDALHQADLKLALTLGTPQEDGAAWDTEGQDWALLGESADIVYLQMPLDPTSFSPNGAADNLLDWATRQIDRRKLIMQVNAGAVDRIGESFTALSNEDALANFGTLEFVTGGEEVEPDSPVEVVLSGDATPLEWDGNSLTYKYSYEANDQTHFVWLANPAALAQRLSLASSHNLRGVAVQNVGDVADGAGYAAALSSATGTGAAPETSGAAIVWTVRDADESVLASESGSDLAFAWDGGAVGNYTINADFALGDLVAPLDSVAVAVADADAEVAVETDTGAAQAEVEEEEDTETGTSTPPIAVGDADAVTNTNANVRTGPGLSYGLIANGATAGTQVTLIGRNSDASWLQVRLPDGQEGWIFANLLTINNSFNVSALDVVNVDPPVASGGGDNGGGGSTTPVAPPPPPVTNTGFALGGQSAGMPIGAMQASGMTWIKRQHKWSPGNTGSDVQGLISEGHNAGFKVLLSIPGQLNPSSIDFNSYVEFLRSVAALPDPPDAIEVWNEMNITREWPAGQINPASYVNSMLKPAYQAIKAANSNVMVITGAPAPTGFFGGGCGGGGCDDAPYIAGMMAAGAGSYSDCIGVHYNEGIMPPAATSGDPRGNGGHYTRYFQGMVNAYVAAGAGQLCFTELGYLSGEEWGFVPAGFLWTGTYNLTVAQQAQYLAEAVSLGANSGRVRMIIIFNVDFTTWGDDPQAGYAMIRPNGSCPACDTVGAVMRGR